MKAIIWPGLVLTLFAAALVQAQGAGDAKKSTPKTDKKEEKSVSAFMRQKLELSKQALEGIVNEDYLQIKKAADDLVKIGHHSQFDVFPLDEYQHLSAEFRRIAKALSKEAEKKNIDGAVVVYTQLTMSCVDCHKFTRRTRMASSAPLTGDIQTSTAQ